MDSSQYPAGLAYVDQHIEAYQRDHGRFLHADDALSILHLGNAAEKTCQW
jgi:hypothetical protein